MLYKIIKLYIKTGLFLFYKKIKVTGKKNVPTKGPILFVANHQNAMMDPLLIATSNKSMYFLARASAFKNKLAAKILTNLHLVKIYRRRDGVDSKKLNEAVFDHCLELLNEGKNMLIFPEGSHHIMRKVRSLRTGFIRIAFDYLEANKEKDLLIIPIGLNYDNTLNYGKTIHMNYGKPISTRQFFNPTNLEKSKDGLIHEVHKILSELSVNINDEENYQSIISSLEESEFLTPNITNKKLMNFIPKATSVKKKKSKNIFYYLMMLNSFIPFMIWNWLKPKVEAIEFRSTAKYSLGLTVFPVFYTIQTLIINHYFGNTVALVYVAICFLLVIFSTKTR